MLRYVQERKLIDLSKLDDFSEEAKKLLIRYTNMPKEEKIYLSLAMILS